MTKILPFKEKLRIELQLPYSNNKFIVLYDDINFAGDIKIINNKQYKLYWVDFFIRKIKSQLRSNNFQL